MNQIKHIRKRVFQLNQSQFALVAGVKQPTVSRWEKGTPLSLDEARRIRDAAIAGGLLWDDSWFFETPPQSTNAQTLEVK
mgnify:CR=1 FL=1